MYSFWHPLSQTWDGKIMTPILFRKHLSQFTDYDNFLILRVDYWLLFLNQFRDYRNFCWLWSPNKVAHILWLNIWHIYNPSDHLTAWVFMARLTFLVLFIHLFKSHWGHYLFYKETWEQIICIQHQAKDNSVTQSSR